MEIYQKEIQDVGEIKYPLQCPLSVGIEINNKCNLRCIYCYNEKHSNLDMKVEDFSKIISILKKIRVFSIMISGGEPTCHNNFKDICRILKNSKLVTALITNGLLIHNYKNLINNTFKSVYISIDGPEDIHNKLRGSNCFQTIVENLKIIKIRKVMSTTLTKLNAEYLEEIIKTAIRYKFDALCLFLFKPVGMGRMNRTLLAIDAQTIEKIQNKLTYLRKRFNIKITFVNPLSTVCYAGKYLIYILPDGRIKPCAYSHFIIGNILYEKWDKLWKKSQNFPSICHVF